MKSMKNRRPLEIPLFFTYLSVSVLVTGLKEIRNYSEFFSV